MSLATRAWVLWAILSALGAGRAAASVEVLDRIVAVIGEDIVTQSELEARLRAQLQQLSPAARQSELARTRAALLDKLVDERLIAQGAKQLRLGVEESEIDRAIDSVATANGLDRAAVLDKVRELMPVEDYRAELRRQILELRLLNQVAKRPDAAVGAKQRAQAMQAARAAWLAAARARTHVVVRPEVPK